MAAYFSTVFQLKIFLVVVTWQWVMCGFFFLKVSCCIQREPSVLVVELLLIFYAKEETI